MSIIQRLLMGGELPPLLIIFGFESGSGGEVPNDVATINGNPDELEISTALKILRADNFDLEYLHVGVNNNTAHFGLDPTTHGWHIGLKNRTEEGVFGNRKVYICEFGQGGSDLAQWGIGGDYNDAMIARYNAAISAIIADTGQEPVVIMFDSWGINDSLESTNPTTFTTGYLALLDQIDAIYPVRAYMIDKIFDDFEPIRSAIQVMVDTRPNLRIQDMQGLEEMGDGRHLYYQGNKDMVDLKIQGMLPFLGQQDTTLDFDGKIIYIFGDSISVGYVAVPFPDNGWTYHLTSAFNSIQSNHSVQGSTMEERTPSEPLGSPSMQSLLDDIPTYQGSTDAILIFAYGMNDWGSSGAYPDYNPTNYILDYTTAIHTAIDKGWPVTHILCVGPSYILDQAFTFYHDALGGTPPSRSDMLDFIAACQTVANSFGVKYIDTYTVMENNTPSSLINAADGVHPVNAGHLLIYQTIYDYLINFT